MAPKATRSCRTHESAPLRICPCETYSINSSARASASARIRSACRLSPEAEAIRVKAQAALDAFVATGMPRDEAIKKVKAVMREGIVQGRRSQFRVIASEGQKRCEE
jgi:hypothetical protein